MISKATENEKLVIKMWEDGKTASEIAIAVGISRNAIAGKLHRLRTSHAIGYKSLQRRVAAMKANATKMDRKIVRVGEARLKEMELEQAKSAKEDIRPLAMEPVRKPTGRPVPLMKLGPLSCRYVVSGVMTKDFLFCNEVKKTGSSYCPEHHARCCVPNYTMKQREKLNDVTIKPATSGNNSEREGTGTSAD